MERPTPLAVPPVSESRQLRALRGATTASDNTVDAINEAVAELVDALVERNALSGPQLLSVTFSVTTIERPTRMLRSNWKRQ